MKNECSKCGKEISGFKLLSNVLLSKESHLQCNHCGSKVEIENKRRYYIILFVSILSVFMVTGNLYFRLIELSYLKGLVFGVLCSALCYVALAFTLPKFMKLK